jgi:hypothetical protein
MRMRFDHSLKTYKSFFVSKMNKFVQIFKSQPYAGFFLTFTK